MIHSLIFFDDLKICLPLHKSDSNVFTTFPSIWTSHNHEPKVLSISSKIGVISSQFTIKKCVMSVNNFASINIFSRGSGSLLVILTVYIMCLRLSTKTYWWILIELNGSLHSLGKLCIVIKLYLKRVFKDPWHWAHVAWSFVYAFE